MSTLRDRFPVCSAAVPQSDELGMVVRATLVPLSLKQPSAAFATPATPPAPQTPTCADSAVVPASTRWLAPSTPLTAAKMDEKSPKRVFSGAGAGIFF